MGRMNDALRKAAEERERKRRQKSDRSSDTGSTVAPVAPVEVAPTEAVAVDPKVRTTPPPEETLRDEKPVAPAAVDSAVDTPRRREPESRPEPASRQRPDPEPTPRVAPDPAPAARSGPVTERPAGDSPAPTPSASSGGSRAERARAKARREREAPASTPAPVRPEATPAAPTRESKGVDPRVVCFHSPRDPRAEQMRGVRTSLLTMDTAPKSVAITSGSPGEGKSLACANLAASLVEGGSRRVLLVDANLRHPELHEIVAARVGPGLSDLMGGTSSDPSALVQETGIPGVDILCAGESLENPGSLLNPKALAGVLGLLEGSYDFVVVDTPALDEYADAAVMAPEVDGAILVCAVEGPPRAAAEKALDLLESARTRVLGVLATNCG